MTDTITGPEKTLVINGADVTFRPVSHRKITPGIQAWFLWSAVVLNDLGDAEFEAARWQAAGLISNSTGVSRTLVLTWSEDDFAEAADAAYEVNAEQFTDPKALAGYRMKLDFLTAMNPNPPMTDLKTSTVS